ncbi:reverse transcriptase [Penicillium coprophilum]|uniref:reverse transcriptase n=1 Tax=Penicillium coprophilum TaxID=36646 RepID=UPI00239B4185|nr:reverse transcriptase [Penicillium coprophilum]KAJ5171185.1 reverse transcriptase [Penicillium coprophilum]
MEADQGPANNRPGSGKPYSGDDPGGRPVHTPHTAHTILQAMVHARSKNPTSRRQPTAQEVAGKLRRAGKRARSYHGCLRSNAAETTSVDEDHRKAKSSHWKQFLDEAGEGKLWKAATYMKPRET